MLVNDGIFNNTIVLDIGDLNDDVNPVYNNPGNNEADLGEKPEFFYYFINQLSQLFF